MVYATNKLTFWKLSTEDSRTYESIDQQLQEQTDVKFYNIHSSVSSLRWEHVLCMFV